MSIVQEKKLIPGDNLLTLISKIGDSMLPRNNFRFNNLNLTLYVALDNIPRLNGPIQILTFDAIVQNVAHVVMCWLQNNGGA